MTLTLLFGGSGSTAAAFQSTTHTGTGTSSSSQAYEQMVFLGDSLTVGYEPGVSPDQYDGFTTRLAEQELFRGAAKAENDGILGLTSTGLKNYMDAITAGKSIRTSDIQSNLPGAVRTLDGAQTAQDIRSADLITITIGGNDFLNALGSLTSLPQDLSSINLTPVIEGYRSNLNSILEQLTALNPDAVIVLADQYQPVPLLAGASLYRDLNETAATFSGIVDETASKYTARDFDVRVAHVAPSFQGKELAMTHIGAGDIHPNATGYQAMAVAFSTAIWGKDGYQTPHQSADQTIPVIYANGKKLQTSDAPMIRSGRTYVALRDVTTALGAKVSWSQSTRTAAVNQGGQQVSIPLNRSTIEVNGQTVSSDAEAFMHNGSSGSKIYVPLALLADQFKYDVQYVPRWKAVFIRE